MLNTLQNLSPTSSRYNPNANNNQNNQTLINYNPMPIMPNPNGSLAANLSISQSLGATPRAIQHRAAVAEHAR